MAEDGGDQSHRNVGWGIYDRLKKVPPFSSPKSAKVVLSPRGRKMDSTEKAASTAARRMVEDHFKQEDDIDVAEPMTDFVLINSNGFTHRGHKQQEEEDIAVCECSYQSGDADSNCGRRCLNVLKFTECTPTHCPCGELCKNQRFQHSLYARTKLVKTDQQGWGVVADEDLKAGDFVIEYCGELVTHREALLRAKVYEASGLKDSYIISLNSTESIDATQKGSLGRFINHSCEPNCEVRKWSVLGEDRLGIFAILDTSCGTPLTYDYKSQFYGVGGSKVRCTCGATYCMGFLGFKSKGHQPRDAYAWEDDAERKDVEEPQFSTDTEDDAPLSSLFDRSKKFRSLSSNKGGLKISAVEKVTPLPSTPTAKETHQGVKHSPQTVVTVESPGSYQPSDNSPLIRRNKTSTAKRWESTAKIATVVGKGKETPAETRVKRVISKLPSKLNVLEEEEINVARKRAKSDAEAQGEEEIAAVTAEQLLSDNLSRVAAFKRARSIFNKLLVDESSSCFPVSEAACAEVEFAHELEMGALSDLKKVCDEIQPAVRDSEKAGLEIPPTVSQKWLEARCNKLRSTLDFHFSIVRHLAGPTFALSQPTDSSPPP